jgi:excisionase family DNA binding protein
MTEEIKPNGVYTTEEVEKLLKVSNSTVKRLLKNGILKANKVGKQYRVLGLEILKLISPKVEKKAIKSYLDLKNKAIEVVKDW